MLIPFLCHVCSSSVGNRPEEHYKWRFHCKGKAVFDKSTIAKVHESMPHPDAELFVLVFNEETSEDVYRSPLLSIRCTQLQCTNFHLLMTEYSWTPCGGPYDRQAFKQEACT